MFIEKEKNTLCYSGGSKGRRGPKWAGPQWLNGRRDVDPSALLKVGLRLLEGREKSSAKAGTPATIYHPASLGCSVSSWNIVMSLRLQQLFPDEKVKPPGTPQVPG